MPDQPMYEGENLHVYPRTMFGTAFVYDVELEDGDEVRLLEVGGMFESATYLDERRFMPTFEYYRSFDALFEAFSQPSRVLMLGGGGCAYPKHFVHSQPHGTIDVVEVDPAIMRIARKHFFVDELLERLGSSAGRLNLVCSDARAFLEAEGPAYEAIINDVFAGGDAPQSLVDNAGLQAVRARLQPGGLYLINFICSMEEDARPVLELVAQLRRAFAHVHVIPCADEVFGGEDNNLIIATDGSYEFAGELPLPPDELLGSDPS